MTAKAITARNTILAPMVLVALLLALPTFSFGNDSRYYGSGVTVYPIQSDDIQLVSETITITKGDSLEWAVDATLNFKNYGGKTSVQMGFPFDTYGPWDETDQGEGIPDPNFRTFVNGKEIEVYKKEGWAKSPLEDLDYPIVYTFTVPFEKGEARAIHHTYSVRGTEWSTGDYQFQYILKTGALWKGVIERIEARLILQGAAAGEITAIQPKAHKREERQGMAVLSWEFTNVKPDFNIVIDGKLPRPPYDGE